MNANWTLKLLLVGIFASMVELYAFGEQETMPAPEAPSLPSLGLNVRSFGAVGDGKADDTAAIQKAIDAAQKPENGGEIFFPAGTYRITRTVMLEKCSSLILRGQGASALGPQPLSSTLAWNGPAGGTLLKSVGITGCVFQDLNLSGRLPGDEKDGGEGLAGILYHATSAQGAGNMINKFANVGLYNSIVGVQMGGEGPDMCNSDIQFDFITMRGLSTGFLVKNIQGVDYTFSFLFAFSCGKVLHFEKGGNLLVNTSQMTDCGVFLEISGGGRNAGTYTCNNVRVESSDGGESSRFQLLRCRPVWKQANVKFIGFDDCQWNWSANSTPKRMVPLCEIGPGSFVTIESSIFNSPVASVDGEEKAPASLILRECSFGYVSPETAVSANQNGFFKIIHPATDSMAPLPDLVKWPAIKPVELDSAQDYNGIEKNAIEKKN